MGYLGTRIPRNLDISDQLRLAVRTFFATVVSVSLVHQFMPEAQPLRALLVHSLTVALVYAVCVLLVSGFLIFLVHRTGLEGIQVWHLWAMSFLAFNLGYFLPIADSTRFALHPNANAEHGFLYPRLLPIWALVTYVFVQAYTRRALQDELVELQRLNEALTREESPPTGQSIHVASGKHEIRIDADRISHISVEDHYCYIHHCGASGWEKTEVALPLREVVERAPGALLLIHRSHAVNPAHLERIDRKGRTYRVTLKNGAVLPVSRHRLNEVLPQVRAHLRDEHHPPERS